jgi:catechol 2,3-dioxygenase-like lactoylglutathione lyase family enzyme
MQSKFTHVGVKVRDLENSFESYSTVLGMNFTGRGKIENGKNLEDEGTNRWASEARRTSSRWDLTDGASARKAHSQANFVRAFICRDTATSSVNIGGKRSKCQLKASPNATLTKLSLP